MLLESYYFNICHGKGENAGLKVFYTTDIIAIFE
jgi:hypothetical protein